MAKRKAYTGIILEDNYLKIATIQISGKKVKLLHLDKVRLVENLQRKDSTTVASGSEVFGASDQSLDDDIIFGMDDSDEDAPDAIDLDDLDEGLDDLDFDNLDDEGDDGFGDTDMMSESEESSSNELLIYNLLSGINPK